MLKRVAVLIMTLASFGAVLPMTAAAAERGIGEKQVVVEKRVVQRDQRPAPRVEVRRAKHMCVRHDAFTGRS